MFFSITPELPNTPDALALISELEAYLQPLSPPEAQFGFSVEKLIAEGVPFFVIRVNGVAAGCGGIKLYEDYGELKRMYVRPQYRGLGLGKQMINHLTNYAIQHGITILRLETGYNMYDAMRLYERMGFQKVAAFGEYRESPYNVFYEKRII